MAQAEDRFRGKVAVITGAGAGIGEGLARAASAIGMKVMVSDIDGSRADAVARSLQRAGAEAVAFEADVADSLALEALADDAYDKLGDVSLLINNAGIELLGFSWELPFERWKRTLDINVLGVVNGLRAFVPRMLASGEPAWIGNLSSIGGVSHSPLHAAYMVSKHAVLALTECLALEIQLLGKPLSVSAILPGAVASRIFEDGMASDERPVVAAFRAQMAGMLREQGLAPLEAGHLILEGVAAGDFWVSPHPEILRFAANTRSAFLASLSVPELTAQMRPSVMPATAG